jgi:hypothetical protein
MRRLRNRYKAIRLPLLLQTVVFTHAIEYKQFAKMSGTESLRWTSNPMPGPNADVRERQNIDPISKGIARLP